MEDDAVAWTAFLEWCSGLGISRSAVAVESRPGRGRCLVCSRDCAAGEGLVLVPSGAILAEGMRGSSYKASHWMLGLVHRLLEEDALGESSSHAPYVALLLGAGPAPDLGEFATLPGCAGRRARYLTAERRRVVEELRGAMQGCSAERAARALHAVDTRTIYSKRLGVRALVPVFDFMNHDVQPNAVWSMDEQQNVSIEATRAISAGEEVLICYDDLPNARLLLTYGFVVPGLASQHASLEVLFQLPPASSGSGRGHGGGSCGSAEEAPDAEQQPATAEVRILSDGAVHRRAAMGPLLAAARQRAAAEARPADGEDIFAQVLLGEASRELEEWLKVPASSSDPRVLELAAQSAEALRNFVSRLRAWLSGGRPESVMSALSRAPPVDVDEISSGTGSDSEGS